MDFASFAAATIATQVVLTRLSARAISTGLSLILCSALFGQSIRTIAGGATDDGRPATVAGVSLPHGIATDAAGNIYFTTSDNKIRRVAAASGLITTIAGLGATHGTYSGDGGQAVSAGLNFPLAVTLDPAGNVFISDANNMRVRKVSATNGVITTFAGNGTFGSSGDKGPATMAQLSPSALVTDPAGNLYIADTCRIRRVEAGSGIITTVAGNGTCSFSGDGGPATAAGFSASGLVFDPSGNLYIADGRNERIRKVSVSSGIITTIAGNGAEPPVSNGYRGTFSGDGGPATAAGLASPGGLVFDSAGNLYLADTGNGRIRRIDAISGVITTFAGNGSVFFSGDGGPATESRLANPSDVAIDLAGNLYIADQSQNRIRKVSASTAIITTIAGNGGAFTFFGDGGPATGAKLNGPQGMSVDPLGNVYIADSNNGRIRKVAAGTGTINTIAGGGDLTVGAGDGVPATSAFLLRPYAVTLDSKGNVYIADFQRIRKIAADSGIITTVAGTGTAGFSGDGGPATAARLYLPSDLLRVSAGNIITLDSAGNLYIADTYNQRVRKVMVDSGNITTIAGRGTTTFTGGFSGDNGPATAAELNNPSAVALDPSGNLYIADTDNRRVRMVSASLGIITTVVGGSATFFSGDGGPALGAGIYRPSGLTFDAAGNLFIADSGNLRIRKVSAGSGVITTIAGNGNDSSTETYYDSTITGFYQGDGGPASTSAIAGGVGVAVDVTGNVYVADRTSDRIRAIPACVTLSRPLLESPANGETAASLAPRLAWSITKRPFAYDAYDILLDTVNPPLKVVGTGIREPFYSPSNLEPLTTYYWKVIANSDPSCVPSSSTTSDVFAFTTRGSCGSPGTFASTAGPQSQPGLQAHGDSGQ